MILAATSDLHGNFSDVHNICNTLLSSNVDVFVLAGDASKGDMKELEEILHTFRNFRNQKLFVAGNHDLYSASGESSWEKYTKTIPEICRRQSFQYLDEAPCLIDEIAFIGNIGWYDASFRLSQGKIPGRLELPSGREILSWDTLKPEDYKDQIFFWENGVHRYTVGWNDRRFISDIPYEQFLEGLLHRLQEDIKSVSTSSQRIISITHHLPFEAMVTRKPQNVVYSIGNAYMGSIRIGEILASDDKLKTAICGHSHSPGVFDINKLKAYNVSREGRAQLTLINV